MEDLTMEHLVGMINSQSILETRMASQCKEDQQVVNNNKADLEVANSNKVVQAVASNSKVGQVVVNSNKMDHQADRWEALNQDHKTHLIQDHTTKVKVGLLFGVTLYSKQDLIQLELCTIPLTLFALLGLCTLL